MGDQNLHEPLSKRCVLCLDLLTAHESPEHVLLNAFGGRFTTREAICTKCNHRMNEIADSKFAEDYAFWRNYLWLNAGDGDPPPTIRGLQTAGGVRYELTPGGRPEQRGLTFEQDPSNPRVARVSGSAERVARQIPNFAKKMNVPTENFADGIHDGFLEKATLIGSLQRRLTLCAPYQLQSITKSALILWALVHGNDEVCSERFDAARRFALGGPAEEPFVGVSDCRPSPVDPPANLERSAFDHWLVVWSDPSQAVYCHMKIFGFFGYSLRVGTSNAAPTGTMLWTNPVASRIWRGPVSVPEVWHLDLDQDTEIARRVITEFSREAERRQAELAFAAAIDRGVTTHLPLNEEITPNRMSGFIHELSATAVQMLFSDGDAGETLVFPRTREQVLRQLGLKDSDPSGSQENENG